MADGSPTSMSAWISPVRSIDARDLTAILEREPRPSRRTRRVLRGRASECRACRRPAETLDLTEFRRGRGRQRLADGGERSLAAHLALTDDLLDLEAAVGRRMHFEGCRHAHPRAVDEPLAQGEDATLHAGPGELRRTEHLVGTARVAVLELAARFALGRAAIERDPDRKPAARIDQLPLPGPRKRDIGRRGCHRRSRVESNRRLWRSARGAASAARRPTRPW